MGCPLPRVRRGLTAPSRSPFPVPRRGRTPPRRAGPRWRTAHRRPRAPGRRRPARPPGPTALTSRLGGRVRDRRAGRDAGGVLAGRRGEALVRQHPVDDVPPLQDGGRVALAGEDQLPRPRRAGPLGQPLRPAHRRGQARRRSRPARTTPSRRPAGCRSPGEISNAAVSVSPCAAKTVGTGRSSIGLGDPEQPRPELAAAARPARGPRRCRGRSVTSTPPETTLPRASNSTARARSAATGR